MTAAVNSKGRVDVLILRLADELGNRLMAKTTLDFRPELKEVAENLIEDLEVPRVPVTPNSVVRSLLGLPDRSRVSPRPGVAGRRKLRRVV